MHLSEPYTQLDVLEDVNNVFQVALDGFRVLYVLGVTSSGQLCDRVGGGVWPRMRSHK